MYVPEKDPTTNDYHHEREDHCHILKRIAKHTRQGSNQQLNLEHFDEAMRDSSTGLTHAALVGSCPQSVPDAERLLSHHVADFFERYFACAIYHSRETYIQQQRQSTGFHCQRVHQVLTTSGPLVLHQHNRIMDSSRNFMYQVHEDFHWGAPCISKFKAAGKSFPKVIL